MQDIPEEYIIRMGIRQAGEHFAELFMEKWAERRVPVLIEDFTTSFYFIECDKYGYPMRKYTDYLSVVDETTVLKKTIEVEKPLILLRTSELDFMQRPRVFMWQGRIYDKAEVPIENLDVKKLLRLAQKAVQKREGLIIDEVLKNKLIK